MLLSIFGSSNASVVGSEVRVRRPTNLWTGEVPKPSLGVLRHAKSAISGSCRPSRAFVNRDLHVFTAFSAYPLDCGNRGLYVICSNFHASANSFNSRLANSGPLSVMTMDGIPCRANCPLHWLMTANDVFFCSSTTSK